MNQDLVVAQVRNLAGLMIGAVTLSRGKVDAETLVRHRVNRIVALTTPVINLVVLMIGVMTPNRRRVDAETLVRLRVDLIVAQTTPVNNLVVLMIGVMTPKRRRVDVETLVRHRVDRIVALTTPVINLVVLMIGVMTPNRRRVDAETLVRLRVDLIVALTTPVNNLVVLMIGVMTPNRRRVDVVVSSHLTVVIKAVSRNMAPMTIADVATSVPRSVDRAVIVAKWDLHRTISIAEVLIAAPVTLSRRTAVPIAVVKIFAHRRMGRAAIAITSARPRATVATTVVAMTVAATAVVRNRRCATRSASSPFVLWLNGLDRTARALGIPWAGFV